MASALPKPSAEQKLSGVGLERDERLKFGFVGPGF